MKLLLLLTFIITIPTTFAQDSKKILHLAVAANFKVVIDKIIPHFESKGLNRKVKVTIASTGKLYTQIINGGSYDLFLSADVNRPKLLAEKFKLKAVNNITYATGQLVLASNKDIKNLNQVSKNKTLAMPNPKHAPYGTAAMQALTKMKLHFKQTVYAQNSAQALTYLITKQVDYAFIPKSLITKDLPYPLYTLTINQGLHDPIIQNIIKLNDKKLSKDFFDFFQTKTVKHIIKSHGYH